MDLNLWGGGSLRYGLVTIFHSLVNYVVLFIQIYCNQVDRNKSQNFQAMYLPT